MRVSVCVDDIGLEFMVVGEADLENLHCWGPGEGEGWLVGGWDIHGG